MNKYLEILWTILWFSSVLMLSINGLFDIIFDNLYCDYTKNADNEYFNFTQVHKRASYSELIYVVGNSTGFNNNFIIQEDTEKIYNCTFSK